MQFLEITVRERMFKVCAINWSFGNVSLSPINSKSAVFGDHGERKNFQGVCDQLVIWKRVTVSDQLQSCHCLRSNRKAQFLEITVREKIFKLCAINWSFGNGSLSLITSKSAVFGDHGERKNFQGVCDQLVIWKRVTVSDQFEKCSFWRSR